MHSKESLTANNYVQGIYMHIVPFIINVLHVHIYLHDKWMANSHTGSDIGLENVAQLLDRL